VGCRLVVVRAAVELAAAGEPLIVIAQTNEQVDDLVDRLARAAPEPRIGRPSAQEYVPAQVGPHRSGDLLGQLVPWRPLARRDVLPDARPLSWCGCNRAAGPVRT
jgi:hypothetical protein